MSSLFFRAISSKKALSSMRHRSLFTMRSKLLPQHSAPLFTRHVTIKNSPDNTPTPEKGKGMFGKMKGLWIDYGYKAVLCYASLYFLSLGTLGISLENDILNLESFGYDIPTVLDMTCGKYEELTGRKELGVIIHENPRYGILAIALFLNEFLEPLRIGGTLFFLSKLAKKKKIV